jgi:hypothetical protein
MVKTNFNAMITISIPTVDELLLRPVSPQKKEEVLLRFERQTRLTELKQARKHWLESLSKEELIELVMKHMDK